MDGKALEEPKSRRIEVAVRVKPKTVGSVEPSKEEYFQIKDSRLQLKLKPSEEFTQSHHVNNRQLSWDFNFSQVLVEASQEQVYQSTVQPMLPHVLAGYNATVLCYGQTGAGKTHTMMGPKNNFACRGLCPRTIAGLFACCSEQANAASTVRMSYMEIYNDGIYDLLNSDAFPVDAITGEIQGDPTLKLQEDRAGNCHVKGLTKRPIHSEEAALELLYDGELNRAVAEHRLNAGSTRSHCILTFYVETTFYDGAEGDTGGVGGPGEGEERAKVVSSKLHLVDLAGSERVSKTASVGKVAAEAKHINKSLTFLEQVVVALGDRRRTHVPFRNSKLTHVLHDSLGGNCMTLMIANVWADIEQLQETAATLRFASRMLRVKNIPRVNEGDAGGSGASSAAKQLIASQQREIAMLRQELALHDAMGPTLQRKPAEEQRKFTPYPAATLRKIRTAAQQYLDSHFVATGTDVADPSSAKEHVASQASNVFELLPGLHSARAIDAYFQCFRELYAEGVPREGPGAKHKGKAIDEPEFLQAPYQLPEGATVVGESVGGSDQGGGFGLGVADDNANDSESARPTLVKSSPPAVNNSAPLAKIDSHEKKQLDATAGSRGPNAEAVDSSTPASVDTNSGTTGEKTATPSPKRDIPYSEWCAGAGKELIDALVAAKEQARENKAVVREGATQLNASKRRIDELQAELEAAIADTPQQGGGLGDAFPSDSDDEATEGDISVRKPTGSNVGNDPPHIVKLRKELKLEKARYRSLTAKWKEAKSEGKYINKCVTRCKHEIKLQYWKVNGKDPVMT